MKDITNIISGKDQMNNMVERMRKCGLDKVAIDAERAIEKGHCTEGYMTAIFKPLVDDIDCFNIMINKLDNIISTSQVQLQTINYREIK